MAVTGWNRDDIKALLAREIESRHQRGRGGLQRLHEETGYKTQDLSRWAQTGSMNAAQFLALLHKLGYAITIKRAGRSGSASASAL